MEDSNLDINFTEGNSGNSSTEDPRILATSFLMYKIGKDIYFYRRQMKLREGYVFMGVCLSFCSVRKGHYPCLHARHGTYLPLLLTSDDHHWKSVQTCTLEDVHPSPSAVTSVLFSVVLVWTATGMKVYQIHK